MKAVMIMIGVVFLAGSLMWVAARDRAGDEPTSVPPGSVSAAEPEAVPGAVSEAGPIAASATMAPHGDALPGPAKTAPGRGGTAAAAGPSAGATGATDAAERILADEAEVLWGTRQPRVAGPLVGDAPFPFLNDLADIIREKNALGLLEEAPRTKRALLLDEARSAKEDYFQAIKPLLRPDGDDVDAIDAELHRYLERLRGAVDSLQGAGS